MKRLISAALLAALAAPAASFAQDAEDPNTGAFSFTAGIDYTTAYFFRGYNQEDIGLILQPYGEIGFKALESDSLDAGLRFGIWNSLHTEQTGTDGSLDLWYEADLYAAADLVIKDGDKALFSPTLLYTLYTYPNGSFESIQELGVVFGLPFVDSLLTDAGSPVTLSPYVGLFGEIDDGNGSEDGYWEIGLTPSITAELPEVPYLGKPSVGFPIKLGGNLYNDYYTDDEGDSEIFGFGQVGAVATAPLPVPARWGAWTVSAGVHYIHLFADSAELANDGGENYEVLGTVGLKISY